MISLKAIKIGFKYHGKLGKVNSHCLLVTSLPHYSSIQSAFQQIVYQGGLIMKYQTLATLLSNIKRQLFVNKNEPNIKQKCDRHGNLYWQIHDYQHNQILTFGTDTEVRIWLEQRYYSST